MLGAPIRTHRARLQGGIIGLIGVCAFAIILWFTRSAIEGAPTGITVLATLASGLAIVLLFGLRRDASTSVTTHEHGLAWTRRGKRFSVLYDDVAELRVLDATIVIRTKSNDVVLVPANVEDREGLIGQLEPPTATARFRN